MEKDHKDQAVTTVLGNFSWVYQEVRRWCRKCVCSKKIKLYSRRRAAPPGTPIQNLPTLSCPPDCCGPFPYGRPTDSTTGTGIILFRGWLAVLLGVPLVGGFDQEVNKKWTCGKRGKVGLYFFISLPMVGVTHTDNRQTKTHVDKWISGSPPPGPMDNA